MAAPSKQYGLILPKKALQKNLILKKHSVFADDSDEETSVGESLQKEALKKQVMKQTKLKIQKALAEDSTVYEYDSIYDEMQQQKKESNAKELSGKDDKKPKYIHNILKAAEVRKQEQEKRMEKKIQKEREMEGGEFDDKEAFVTSAYKKKLQERAEEEERERNEAALEACLDVTKQKDLSGFYRHLLNQTVGEEKVPKCSLREARIKEEKSASNFDESSQRNKSPDEGPRLKTVVKEEDNPDVDSDLESDSSDDDHKNRVTSKKDSRDSCERGEEGSKHHRNQKRSSSPESSSEEESHHTKTHINCPRSGESGTSRREKDEQHKERDSERRDKDQEKDYRREKEDQHRYGDHTNKDNNRKRDEQENKQRGKDRKEREGHDKEWRKEREDKYSDREREKERLRNGKDRYSDRERGEKCREREEHLKDKRERDDKDDKKYRDRKESRSRTSERERDKKQRSLEKDRQPDQERETKATDRKSGDKRTSDSERLPEPKHKGAEDGQEEAENVEEKSPCVSKFAKRSSEETVMSARDRYLARQMARVGTKAYIEKEED
uniref:Nuclear speckle splicing regulatory protein 1 n=1 Tax=Pelusios castaneus TaxID=367368 RepID=A0A8C8S7Q0_9SAUR